MLSTPNIMMIHQILQQRIATFFFSMLGNKRNEVRKSKVRTIELEQIKIKRIEFEQIKIKIIEFEQIKLKIIEFERIKFRDLKSSNKKTWTNKVRTKKKLEQKSSNEKKLERVKFERKDIERIHVIWIGTFKLSNLFQTIIHTSETKQKALYLDSVVLVSLHLTFYREKKKRISKVREDDRVRNRSYFVLCFIMKAKHNLFEWFFISLFYHDQGT